MVSKLKIVSFDPALSNFGIALMTYDVELQSLKLEKLAIVQTEVSHDKRVRKSSDDLERARMLFRGMTDYCKDRVYAIAEVPFGAQSARASMSNGIVVGVLAGCPIPLIQVSPSEVKMASVGIKTATKGEMIEWAMKKHPHKDWLMRKSKGEMVPMNDNEHLADAVAATYAGIKTDQFQQSLAWLRALPDRVSHD